MHPHRIERLAKDLMGASERTIDDELRAEGLSIEERIAVKNCMSMMAAAQSGKRLSARLATDYSEYRQGTPTEPLSNIEKMLTRIGVDLSRHQAYSERELDEMLQRAGITDPIQRIGLKHEALAKGLIRHPRAEDSGSLYGRSMRASGERPRGRLLLDSQGKPVVLRS